MKVTLLNSTPNPQETIIQAVRTCYNSFDKQNETSDDNLLKYIVKKNESPLEFATFIFLLSGVSRIASHQIVRHRIASYAQKSQRYCEESNFQYVIPEEVKNNVFALSAYEKAISACTESYNQLVSLGIKKEDARFVLPNACATEMVCSFNARSLRNFITLRSSVRAQWEIREIALRMKQILREVAPLLAEGL